MSADADRKRDLLTGWWAGFLPARAARLFSRGEELVPAVGLARLPAPPASEAVYVLFVEEAGGPVPVYIGKAERPAVRWGQHLAGWQTGVGTYARWRDELLDPAGRVRDDLTFLVVPLTDVTRPPVPGFPVTVGTVEYQLIGLAEAAYPGRLLNSEGKARC